MARRKSCEGKAMTHIDLYGVWLNRLLEPKNSRVPEETQRQVLDEMASQLFEVLEEALKQKDPWAAVKIFARGERIVAQYTAVNFTMLEPLHQALQATLHTFWRMARRQFLKRALKAPDHEYQFYLDTLREGWLDGLDAQADFRCAERHVDFGASLFGDLRKG
jgi:hypothetical protein